MSYCTRCGAYIPQGDSICPACGYDPEAEQAQAHSGFTGGAAQAVASQSQQSASSQSQQSGSYQTQQEKSDSEAMTWAPWNQQEEKEEQYSYQQPEDEHAVSEELRRLTVLSYIGPLFLLPLLLHKDNRFVRYHANQGLCLLIFETITGWIFGGLLYAAAMLFSVYCVVLGAKAAASGKTVELPLIGKWRILKGQY